MPSEQRKAAAAISWGASVIYMKCLQKKTSISMLMITLWQMVIGVIAAWLQLGKRPTPIEAGGMSLIGAAPAMLAWNPLESGRGG